MRSLGWLALVSVCVVVVVACGGGAKSTTKPAGDARTEPGGKPQNRGVSTDFPPGCTPPQVADRLMGMFRAVRSREQENAVRYIAAGEGLVGFAVYNGRGAGALQFESAERSQVYRQLTEMIHADDHPRLLAAEVGTVGPLAPERKGPSAKEPPAGIGFSVALGGRSANGKAGIDCEAGRFYSLAMTFESGLEKQQACGEYVHLKSREPLVCAVGANRPTR